MSRYAVYELYGGSRFVGVFEAKSKEEAEEMAAASERSGPPTLCHQCSGEIDLGDCTGYLVEKEDRR